MRARHRSLFVSLTVVLFAVALGGCDWAQLGFDATHAGFNPSEPALDAAAVAHLTSEWHRDLVHGPAVSGGRVFATASGTPNYELFSLDPATGAVRWQVSTGAGIATGPAVNGTTVYVIAGSFSTLTSWVQAYDTTTGAFRWRTPTDVPTECAVASIDHPPTAGAGLVMFTSISGPDNRSAVCAFDATTGAFEWSAPVLGDAGIGAPAIADGKVYFATFDAPLQTTVRAVATTNGAVAWTKTVTNASLAGSAIVVGGRVLVPAGKLLTFDAATGAPGWTSTADEVSATTDTVIAVTDGAVRALRLDSGVERWSIVGPGGTTYDKPAIAGDVVYLGSTQDTANRGHCCSHVDLLDVGSGGRIATIEPGDAQFPPTAIASNGVVYVDDAGITAYRP